MVAVSDDPAVDVDADLGSRAARFDEVEGELATVALPSAETHAPTIDVVGSALDDETGTVEVTIDAGVGVRVSLGPDEARQLAETIASAAVEAEADVPTE